MNKKVLFFCFWMQISSFMPIMAQFYTITADTLPSVEQEATRQPDEEQERLHQESEPEDDEAFFPPTRGHEIEIERDIPVFVSVRDSMMAALLQDRLNVCLPLDFLKVSSHYGHRADPILRCTRFHDGIDLRCSYAHVYAMLPARIKEVHYGNKGYGNYVILDHGNIECLYGHLSNILVKEGEIVSAGTVVAISGNTGKSTAPHLHIRLRKDGKRVNPLPFIDYLNGYITRLRDRITTVRFGKTPSMQLTIDNLAKVIRQNGLSHPRIIIAQALLETGYFTSRVCTECNNLFGLRKKDGSYYRFNSWEESVKAYKDYVQYKYKSGSYLRFLKDIGYAEDPEYITKVMQIAKTI